MKTLENLKGKEVKNAVAVKGGKFVHQYQQNESATTKL